MKAGCSVCVCSAQLAHCCTHLTFIPPLRTTTRHPECSPQSVTSSPGAGPSTATPRQQPSSTISPQPPGRRACSPSLETYIVASPDLILLVDSSILRQSLVHHGNRCRAFSFYIPHLIAGLYLGGVQGGLVTNNIEPKRSEALRSQ